MVPVPWGHSGKFHLGKPAGKYPAEIEITTDLL
jgi:hypothetical protein